MTARGVIAALVVVVALLSGYALGERRVLYRTKFIVYDQCAWMMDPPFGFQRKA